MATIDRYLPASADEGPDAETRLPRADEDQESSGFSINLRDIRAMAWRQRWLMGAIVLSALVIGVIVTLLMTPIYQASSTVQIKQEPSNIVAGQDVNPTTSMADAGRYLQTQQDLIASRSLASRVSDRLNLARDDRFVVAMGGKPLDASVPRAQQAGARRERAIAYLLGNISSNLPASSRVVSINFRSPVPVVAANVANAYAQSLIEQNVDTSFNSSRYARNFLAGQIDLARERLGKAERRAIEYARQEQLIDASDAAASKSEDGSSATGRSLTTAGLVGLNEQLGTVRGERIASESRWRQAQSTPLMQLPEVVANASIGALQAQHAQVTAQLNQLRQRYSADYPEVAQLRAQLTTIDQQTALLAGNIRDSLRNSYEISRRQQADIEAAISSARGDVLGEQQRRVELNVLAQDVSTYRQTLNDLLQRYNQVNSASGIVLNNISMVDEASVPGRPMKPDPVRNLMVALALGLAVAIAAALMREAFDDTVRSPEDVESKLRLPVLGSVPLTAAPDINVENLVSDATMPMSEAYYSIRAALDFSTSHGRPKTFLVTSSGPSEGKTTTAFAIASDYARMGLRTLLVDCDLRRPSVHRLAQLPLRPGLFDVLSGTIEMNDAVKAVQGSSLEIVTAGKSASSSVQIFSSNVLETFIEQQSAVYDMIVLDTAPVMGIADTPLIARSVEGIVLVIEAGRSHRGQAKNTLKRLRETGGRILGTVITKFDARSAGYSYDYYSSYYTYKSDAA